MAYSVATKNITGVAGEAITIYRLVNPQSDQTWDMADATTDLAAGISAESVASGVEFPIAIFNGAIGLIELGATIAAGVMVSAGTNGVAAAASTTTNEIVYGPLLVGGDSGEIVPIIMSVRTIAPA